MSLFERNYTTRTLYTSATMAATGATTLVAAPGGDISIVVHSLHVLLNTTTTGRQEVSFREGAGGALRYRSHGISLGTIIFQKEFNIPWIIDTNTAFLSVLSITAASTPGAEVTVGFRLLDRAR